MEEIEIGSEVFFKVNDMKGIVNSITYYEDGHCIYNVSFEPGLVIACNKIELMTNEEKKLKNIL